MVGIMDPQNNFHVNIENMTFNCTCSCSLESPLNRSPACSSKKIHLSVRLHSCSTKNFFSEFLSLIRRFSCVWVDTWIKYHKLSYNNTNAFRVSLPKHATNFPLTVILSFSQNQYAK